MKTCEKRLIFEGILVERLTGIEPVSSAWKADALALVLQARNGRFRVDAKEKIVY